MNKNTKNIFGRLTFAFMSMELDEPAGSVLLKNALIEAKKKNINLVTFYGGRIGNSEFNIAYKLCRPELFEGFISWATRNPKLVGYLAPFKESKMVIVTLPVPGHPCVGIDLFAGTRESLNHMITQHDCKKIAFIQGLEDHFYAKERFRAYKETLEKYNIPFNEKLISPNNEYTAAAGTEAVVYFIDNQKLKIPDDMDCIIANNNTVMIGAITELIKRGFKVPGDIPAMSLNTALGEKIFYPPISTVFFSYTKQMETIFSYLFSLIDGKQVPELTLIPTELQIMKSCGCQSEELDYVQSMQPQVITTRHKKNITRKWKTVFTRSNN